MPNDPRPIWTVNEVPKRWNRWTGVSGEDTGVTDAINDAKHGLDGNAETILLLATENDDRSRCSA